MIALAALALTAGLSPISVSGSGFLRLMKSGQTVYARQGQLAVVNGELGIGTAKFLPNIFVPAGSGQISVAADGTVTAQTPGGAISIGRVLIAVFPRGEAMNYADGFFTCADRPKIAYPGTDAAGSVQSGATASPTARTASPAADADPNPTVSTPMKPEGHASEGNAASSSTARPSAGKSDSAGHKQPARSEERSKPPEAAVAEPKAPEAAHVAIPNLQPGQLAITVNMESDVSDRSFTIGDIADIQGPKSLVNKVKAIWCGNTPPIGFPRKLSEQTIRLHLASAHIDPDKCIINVPDGAVVELQCQTVSADELLAKAQEAIAGLVGSQTSYADTTSISPIAAPLGDLKLDVTSPQSAGNGAWFVNISASVAGQIVGTRQITLAPTAGSIFVKPGDMVTVEFKAGTASVTVPGQVVSKAFLGQAVQVRVASVGARTTLQSGILVSANRVDVKL